MNLFLIISAIMIISNLVAIIYMTFVQKQSVAATTAWLLVFFFLPGLGFVLYFFLGSTYKVKMFSKKYRLQDIEKSYEEVVEKQIHMLHHDHYDFKDDDLNYYAPLVLANANNNLSYYTDDNNVEIFVDGEEHFKCLFEDIKQAKESIHVLYFIFKSRSVIGEDFIDLLTKKAQEGVEVRLIYDRFGCLQTRKKDFQKIIDAGGEVYQYLPSLFKTCAQVNYRMHRKIVVIDGKIAYTGGMNIGDEYVGRKTKIYPWRDTAIRITGSSVISMQLRFLSDFIFLDNQYKKSNKTKYQLTNPNEIKKLFPDPLKKGHIGMQVVSSGPDSDIASIRAGYLKMITMAKNYIYIESPYFVPNDTLLDCIRLAVVSGIDVRVIIPGVPDKKYAYYVTLSYVEELLKCGVKVYLYNGFIHSKMIVIDDMVSTIGTTNFDIRSFVLDYEINAFLYDEKTAKACRRIFKNDAKNSKKLSYQDFHKRGLKQKFLEAICKLFSPLV